MGKRLILMLLFLGIFFCSSYVLAEKSYAEEDEGYSEKELKEIRGMSDKELKQMKNYWGKKAEEAEKKMVEPARDLGRAEGELSRARRGEYSTGDVIKGAINDPQSLVDDEKRLEKTQYKRDKAYEEWDKARDEFDNAYYKQGVADIYLNERKESNKKR